MRLHGRHETSRSPHCCPLKRANMAVVNGYLEWRHDARDVGASTINREPGPARTILGHAQKAGRPPYNALAGVRKLKEEYCREVAVSWKDIPTMRSVSPIASDSRDAI